MNIPPEQRLKEIEEELAKIDDEAKALVRKERETPMDEFVNTLQYWVWLIFIREKEKLDAGYSIHRWNQ